MPTLIIDGTTSAYANLAAATAAIAAQAATGCLIEGLALSSATRSVFTSSFTTGTFSISVTTDDPGGGPGASVADAVVSRMNLTAAGGLSVTYNFSASGPGSPSSLVSGLLLYADDQTTLLDSFSGSLPASGTWTPTISADGYYWLEAEFAANYSSGGASTGSMSWNISNSGMQPCTVRAAYGGGPSYLICT